jgi:molybdopterin-biosynthesis enzyme MoeA-like protein
MDRTSQDRVTAGVLIIGDEILSGRTQDTNLRDIARYLGVHGVDLAEARTVPDVHEEIIAAHDDLRPREHTDVSNGGYPTAT